MNSTNNEKIPVWDLSGFYLSVTDPQIEKDLNRIRQLTDIEAKYRGKLASLSTVEFYELVSLLEEDVFLTNKIYTYFHLLRCQNINDENLALVEQKVSTMLDKYTDKVLFIDDELENISSEVINKWLSESSVEQKSRYEYWLTNLHKLNEHNLNDEMLRCEQQKMEDCVDIYRRTMTELEFEYDGIPISKNEIFRLSSSSNEYTRHKAGACINLAYKKKADLFVRLLNELIKAKSACDKLNNFETPVAEQNHFNGIEQKTLDDLVKAVTKSYDKISHRYSKLSKHWLKSENFGYWDRGVVFSSGKNNFSWNEAINMVMDSFGSFSPKMTDLAKFLLEKGCVDAKIRKGKCQESFCCSSDGFLPFIMLNYDGRASCVDTLAHELGHGIHHCILQQRKAFSSQTPAIMSETVAKFAEYLLFRNKMKNVKTDDDRLSVLSRYVGDKVSSIHRQISYHLIEERIYDACKSEALSTEKMCKIWSEETARCYGIKMGDEAIYCWADVPHMFVKPFYMYSYAFAECMVVSLAKIYEEKSVENFEEKFFNMLYYSSEKNYAELFKDFGLDVNSSEFWENGLKLLEGYIDELEKLSVKLGC